MKQSLPPARNNPSRIVLALLLLASGVGLFAGCVTRQQSDSSAVHRRLDSAKVELATGININAAGPEELERLPGVGKVIAERIVLHRAQYGPFRRAEHLLLVRGISDRRFRELRPLIVVE